MYREIKLNHPFSYILHTGCCKIWHRLCMY